MALSLNYLAHSEIGLVRKNNQDSAYASPGLLLVADGMGGAAAGDLASAVVVRAFRELDSQAEGEQMLDVLAEVVEEANAQIADLVADDPELDGMGSTVCGALFDGERLGLVNVGDSRAYRYRDGELRRLTHDHSWVQTLVDEGRLTEEESLIHPHRSLILRVVNGQSQHNPDLELVEVRPGDRLLFCSDGLSGMVVDEQIAARMDGELVEVRDWLIELAHDTGGSDNITLILADVAEADPAAVPLERVILGSAALIDLDEPLSEITSQLPALLAQQVHQAPLSPEERRYQPTSKRRPVAIVRVLLMVVVPLLVVFAGAGIWYSYTQQQYYVGADGQTVAIFQGIPDRPLGIPLSQVVQSDTTKVADLPLVFREKVERTISVNTLNDGRNALVELRAKARFCILQRQQPPAPPPSIGPSESPGVPSESPGDPSGSPDGSSQPPGEPGESHSPSMSVSQTPPAYPTTPDDPQDSVC